MPYPLWSHIYNISTLSSFILPSSVVTTEGNDHIDIYLSYLWPINSSIGFHQPLEYETVALVWYMLCFPILAYVIPTIIAPIFVHSRCIHRIMNMFSSVLLINFICWFVVVLTLLPLDSMNEIIDKYNTHSKNLGKAEPPSLDLNVCNLSFLYCNATRYLETQETTEATWEMFQSGSFYVKGLG